MQLGPRYAYGSTALSFALVSGAVILASRTARYRNGELLRDDRPWGGLRH